MTSSPSSHPVTAEGNSSPTPDQEPSSHPRTLTDVTYRIEGKEFFYFGIGVIWSRRRGFRFNLLLGHLESKKIRIRKNGSLGNRWMEYMIRLFKVRSCGELHGAVLGVAFGTVAPPAQLDSTPGYF